MALFRISAQLDCTAIPDGLQVAGNAINIPDNSVVPVALSANFNCSYTIKPPKNTFAKITLLNQLVGVNDVIIVTDGLQLTTKINRNYPNNVIFYVFPQTSTTVDVQNIDAASKFQMTITYTSLPPSTQRALQTGQNVNYFSLSTVQRKPISFSSDGSISLTLARSGYVYDKFDNYYIIDGDMDNPKSIQRLDNYQSKNFNSSGNIISIVGLDDLATHTTFILTPSTDLIGYTKFSGTTVNAVSPNVYVNAANEEKVRVVVVAKDANQLVLKKMGTLENENCKAYADTGTPSSPSNTLIDFKSDAYSLPQLFPYPYFSIIVENCDVNFNFSTTLPSNYYTIDSERNGFIFSPTFFNSEADNGYINITFAYTGDEKVQFAVDVDRVTMGNSNSQLDINIYDSKWNPTLSTVISGNQEGTRSRANGVYLNVRMTSATSTKLYWSLTSFSVSIFNLQFIIILAVCTMMISN